jgi:hypothetical protein
VPIITRQSSIVVGVVLALFGLWVWGKIDLARQRQAEYEAAEYTE